MGPRTASSAALQPKHNDNINDDLQAFQLIILANHKHDLYEIVLMMTNMHAARTTGATENT